MLVKQENLKNYFHNCLHSALHKHRVQAEDHTISYLINLLDTFSRSDKFLDHVEGRSPHKPLAMYYSDAVNSCSRYEQNFALRRLGDLSLFIVGLFSNSLCSKTVDVDYYVAMGGSAYGHLSESNHKFGNDSYLSNVFCELSNKFVDFADILSDVNENQNSSNKNILRTYEVWLRTQSKRARNILVEHGIQPIMHTSSMKRQ